MIIATYKLNDTFHSSIKSAMKCIFNNMLNDIKNCNMNEQELKATIQVRVSNFKPMCYCDLYDYAVRQGWIKNGEWQE